MKKILTLLIVAGMFSLVACGPSAEQKEAEAKRIADSTSAAESAMQAAEEAAAAAASAATTVDTAAVVADTVKAK